MEVSKLLTMMMGNVMMMVAIVWQKRLVVHVLNTSSAVPNYAPPPHPPFLQGGWWGGTQINKRRDRAVLGSEINSIFKHLCRRIGLVGVQRLAPSYKIVIPSDPRGCRTLLVAKAE